MFRHILNWILEIGGEYMRLKKFISILLIMFIVLITGCSNNVLIDEQNIKLLNYNFNIADLKDIDKTLSNQRYSYSTNINKKYVAVVTYQSKNASITQYLINKDGTLDLNVLKESHFIISLPANQTIAYTWNIKNSIDNGILQFQNRSLIDIPMPESEKGKIGEGYGRENFYFKPLKAGNDKIVLRYEHVADPTQINQLVGSFFEITININIE